MNECLNTIKVMWFYGKHTLIMYALTIIGLYFYWDPHYLVFTLIGYFLFGMFGLEIAHHRYFSHKTFTCSRPTELFLTFCACFCGTGDPLYWSGIHRAHHAHSDTEKDVHQPHTQPFLSWLHANDRSNIEIDWSRVKDLAKKDELLFLAHHWPKIYYGTIALFWLINPQLGLFFIVLPGVLTLALTGAVNVVSHKHGYRNYNSNDTSTNNKILNIFIFGGGYHNNHHGRPGSYTTKLHDHEIDVSGWVIKHWLADTVNTGHLPK